MNTNHTTKVEITLRQLVKECSQDGAYSVPEVVERMGIRFMQLEELAKTDKGVTQCLEFCREICFDNAESDGLTRKITSDTALKYMCENNNAFKSEYEKQQEIELRAKLEKEGKEVATPQPKRIVMIEEIIQTPKQLAHTNVNEKTPTTSTSHQQTQEEIEAERIKIWKERRYREVPSFKMRQIVTEDKANTKSVSMACEGIGAKPSSSELLLSTFCAISGSANQEYASSLLEQTISAFFIKPNENAASIANIINGALLSLAPKDEIEGMLCSRLLVLHNQYMEFMGRVINSEQTAAGVDLNINRATKLMRLWNETLDALSKHRRKGEQKVTVQHISVREGGQAIVNGQLNQGEGADAKK